MTPSQLEWEKGLNLLLWEETGSVDLGNAERPMKPSLQAKLVSFIRQTLTSHDEGVIKKLEALRQKLPARPCINAENHMFGKCFDCEKAKGFNAGLDAAIEILKANLINNK